MTTSTRADGLAERLLDRTLRLVDTPSVSGDETAIREALLGFLPTHGLETIDDHDSVLFLLPAARREGRPLVVLAGHVDTVPPNGNLPGRREGTTVIGRGASDMKGALAVMVEIAHDVSRSPDAAELDVGFLWFGREELPITQSALLPLFGRSPRSRTIDLALVMEPTANAIEVGCLGNLNAHIEFEGVAAHTARPWLGRNAIHEAIGALARVAASSPVDVEVDGLVFREVMSVTSIAGSIAGNVVPDRVEARVNFRYAPTRTPQEAEAYLRELTDAPDRGFAVIGNAPPGPVSALDPLVDRLRRAGDLTVGPKQAWTPVAEFGIAGIPAVNFGPGDPQYAHRDDERVDAAALVRSVEVLRRFIGVRRAG